MSKVGDWFFEKFLNILLSGSSMILNTAPIKKKLAEVLTQKINEQIGTDSCNVSFNELKLTVTIVSEKYRSTERLLFLTLI